MTTMEAQPIRHDSLLDVAPEDRAAGNGGTRRPGNLWTAQAREDMYRRREAGETWETICLDYPNRSRHAMQQQYSMMKKQRALAEGTWTSNRRGRKRKNPSPDKWSLLPKRQKWGDTPDEELTEEEDFDNVGESDDEMPDPAVGPRADYITSREGGETARAAAVENAPRSGSRGGVPEGAWTAVNGDPSAPRPSPLMRSQTDPVARGAPAPRPKPALSPNHHSSPHAADGLLTNGGINSIISVEHPPAAADVVPPIYASSKRRRLSPPEAAATAPPDPEAAATTNGLAASPPAYQPPNVMFDREEFLDILQRGMARATQAAKDHDLDRAARRQTFDAATQRANRRLHDAQERIRWLSYEHGEGKKDRERELAELGKKHVRERQALRAEVEREHQARERAQDANIEALSRHNDTLTRRVAELERAAGLAESGLSVPPAADVEMKDEPLPPKPEISVLPPTSGGPTGTDSSARSWEPAHQHSVQAMQDALTEVDSVAAALGRLLAEIDDLSNKQVLKTLTALQTQNETARATMQGAVAGMGELRAQVESAFAKLRVSAPAPRAAEPEQPPKVNGVVTIAPAEPAPAAAAEEVPKAAREGQPEEKANSEAPAAEVAPPAADVRAEDAAP